MLKAAKILLPSLAISYGGYLSYQLFLGDYSQVGDIVEVRKHSKRVHYYEYINTMKESEQEISRFVMDMLGKKVPGNYFKIQLDDIAEKKAASRFIIGIEESDLNRQLLKEQTVQMASTDIPGFSAVETSLDFTNKNKILTVLQMTYKSEPAIAAYVKAEESKFPGIAPNSLVVKSINFPSLEVFDHIAISYPFGDQATALRETFKAQQQSGSESAQAQASTSSPTPDSALSPASAAAQQTPQK